MKTMIRQGDVLVVPIKKISASVKLVTPEAGYLVLARGEATGHHHSIAMSERVAMFREDGAGGGLFLHVTDAPVVLEHQEHSALQIAPGAYRVVIQRTYRAGMSQRVTD